MLIPCHYYYFIELVAAELLENTSTAISIVSSLRAGETYYSFFLYITVANCVLHKGFWLIGAGLFKKRNYLFKVYYIQDYYLFGLIWFKYQNAFTRGDVKEEPQSFRVRGCWVQSQLSPGSTEEDGRVYMRAGLTHSKITVVTDTADCFCYGAIKRWWRVSSKEESNINKLSNFPLSSHLCISRLDCFRSAHPRESF